jgi:hypothetical protein
MNANSRGRLETRVEVIANAVDAARPAMERRGRHLTVRTDAQDACVDGAPVRLTQAFCNLLNNAARYTPSAGTIFVTTRCESGHIAVAIRDSGSVSHPTTSSEYSRCSSKHVPFLQQALSTAALNRNDWLMCAAIAAAFCLWAEPMASPGD